MAHYVPGSSADAYEAENHFYLRSQPGRLAKLLAHYELYRSLRPARRRDGQAPALPDPGLLRGAVGSVQKIWSSPRRRPGPSPDKQEWRLDWIPTFAGMTT